MVHSSYWFPIMWRKIKHYISKCLKCLSSAPKYGKNKGLLHSIPKGHLPFSTIHIDYLDHSIARKAPHSHKHNFCAFTMHVKLFSTMTTNSNEVIKLLKTYFNFYNKNIWIISDRGCTFTSLHQPFFRILWKTYIFNLYILLLLLLGQMVKPKGLITPFS